MRTRVCLCLAAIFVCFAALCHAQNPEKLTPGTSFPSLKGDTLEDKEITLPDAAAGKVALIVVTFSKSAGDSARVWQEHFVKDFPDATRPEDTHVTSYSVAMLSDAPGFVRGMIRSAMRKGTPQALRSRTITVNSDSKPWKQRVEMHNDKDGYLLLLDSGGKVVWTHHGEFDQKPYNTLKAKITELLHSAANQQPPRKN